MLDCEPMFDYGRQPASWAHTDRSYHQAVARATASTWSCALTTDMRLGFEGGRATARTLLKEGDQRFCALSWSRARPALHLRRGVRAAGVDRAPLAALAGPRRLPRPPVAQPPAAQRAHAEGPDLRAHRRAGRRGDHVAARDAGRRAQLGLPLQLDPRLRLRAVGPAHARLRLGGRRLLLLHRRRRRARRRAAGHVRRRRRDAARRAGSSTTCTATTAPARSASATPPTSSASTTSGARCSTRSTSTPVRRTGSTSGSGRSSSARSRPPSSTGASPTRASGRCAASRSTSRRRS